MQGFNFSQQPNLNSRYRIASHLLLWAGLYVVWIFIFRNRIITISRTMGIEFCYLVFIGINFYFNIYFAVPQYLNHRKYGQFFLSGLLCILFTSWMRAEVALYINSFITHIAPSYAQFGDLYFNSVLNILIWSGALVAAYLVLEKIKAQKYLETIELEKTSTELNFLRAQHNPHFLFNSLNAIYFQIDKSNIAARESLLKLSEMLRYQLYDCNIMMISIEKEMSFLYNYIELQKLRLNSNYDTLFSVNENVKDFEIAPLLFMPLVENAFKYISHHTSQANTLSIKISFNGSLLEFEIINSYEKGELAPKPHSGGIGLTNLRRRLKLLYPERHELHISNDGDVFFKAQLTIKINEDELHNRR